MLAVFRKCLFLFSLSTRTFLLAVYIVPILYYIITVSLYYIYTIIYTIIIYIFIYIHSEVAFDLVDLLCLPHCFPTIDWC